MPSHDFGIVSSCNVPHPQGPICRAAEHLLFACRCQHATTSNPIVVSECVFVVATLGALFACRIIFFTHKIHKASAHCGHPRFTVCNAKIFSREYPRIVARTAQAQRQQSHLVEPIFFVQLPQRWCSELHIHRDLFTAPAFNASRVKSSHRT